MAATLEDAILLAVTAHRGQRDKAGLPYVLHPLRVMLRVDTDAERMAAVLHDVVEDCGVSLDDLRAKGYPEPVVAAVDGLTRRPDETYDAFVDRAAAQPISRRVKIADLEDNMDVRRLAQVGAREQERLDRYVRCWRRLTAAPSQQPADLAR